jgi:hypothetical protein
MLLLGGWIIARLIGPRNGAKLSPLVVLWIATFVHILFWARFSDAFSW